MCKIMEDLFQELFQEGELTMCKIMEDLFQELFQERELEFAKNLLAMGYMPIDKIAEGLELPLETVEALARDMQKSTVNV